jgi:hypothetical protein
LPDIPLFVLLSVLFRFRKRGKSEYGSTISLVGVGGAVENDGGIGNGVEDCSIVDEFE